MKIFNYAKELTKEAGRQVTANDIIRVLSKKKDGLRMTSEIDDELMEYAKMMITGKVPPKPVKKAEPKPAPAHKTPRKPRTTDGPRAYEGPRRGEGPKARPTGKKIVKPATEEEKKVVKPATKTAEAAVEAEVKTETKATEAKAVEKEVKAAAKTEETKTVEKKTVAKTTKATEEKAETEKPAATVTKETKETKEAKETRTSKPAREIKTPRVSKEEKEAKAAKTTKSAKGTRTSDKTNEDKAPSTRRPSRPAKIEAAPAPEENQKRSSGRKGDKSKDKEKEARRENKESRNRREEKRSKKNDFRDMDDMTQERKKKPKKQEKKEEETIKTVTLPEVMTLSEFAAKIKQPVNALIKKLFLEGKMYTVNTDLTYEEAELIALEYNIICEQEVKVDIVEEALKDIEDPEDSLVERPPVVCVMGHVDHGKTSLLDAIRKTSVTEGEAGGITQHIGAYTVKVNGKKITFLDTPGHEAFTAMRLRGAMATDIAILVVAADDGVMPQTVEAINHAKAAGVEIIVAVNKIDKPSANIERVKQELVEYGLIAEDWGGSTVFAPVSAKSHEGIDNLLEMILLTSDILELKANPKRKARGIVIEAKLDKGRGAVATLLVQKGTLKVGDFIAIGESHGRVRAMTDDKQRSLKEATPSMPVEVIGLSTVPNTGEIFIATDTEKEARNISDAFITRGKENLIAETKAKMSLDDIFSQMQEGTLKELNIIIKADVQGSVEALKQSLLKLSNEEIVIKCIHSGVGAINESDVTLAGASDAIIIGFNVRPEPMAKQLADSEKVDIRLYKVIYNAIDDIESAMKGMLDPIYEEKIIGHAVIRQTFKASGVGTIAGTFVEDGAVERNASARITRDGEQIWDGKIASLKRFNDDAKEVKAGFECGIVFEDFNDVRENDTIEVYKMVEVPRD
ncbi:MAG: translation initiation factor IF-2 [Eubacterium sp.]|nr:translation initiation factor IF-2 [Eubacterium sp.]